MSDEASVAIGIALFTGLCVTMWNTDGRLDWLAGVAALLLGAVLLTLFVYDYAITVAGYAAAKAVGDAGGNYIVQEAARGVIAKNQFSSKTEVIILVLQMILWPLPYLFVQIRMSRVR